MPMPITVLLVPSTPFVAQFAMNCRGHGPILDPPHPWFTCALLKPSGDMCESSPVPCQSRIWPPHPGLVSHPQAVLLQTLHTQSPSWPFFLPAAQSGLQLSVSAKQHQQPRAIPKTLDPPHPCAAPNPRWRLQLQVCFSIRSSYPALASLEIAQAWRACPNPTIQLLPPSCGTFGLCTHATRGAAAG